MTELINIVVCTHGRSGSEWFTRLLSDYGGYMKADEDFSTFNQKGRRRVAVKKKINRVVKQQKDYAVKVFYFFIEPIEEDTAHAKNVAKNYPNHYDDLGWDNFLRRLPYENTAFVRLIRKDNFAVAKSHSGARKARTTGGSTKDFVTDEEVEQADLDWVLLNNAGWDRLLENQPHYVVYYEDLKENTKEEMNKVVEYIEWVRSR